MLSWSLLLLIGPLVDVEWSAPEDCPSEEAFVEMVAAEADLRTDADAPPVLAAQVDVVQLAPERWKLTLRLVREANTDARTFEGDSCLAIVQAAALVVSLRVVEWAPKIVPEPEPEPEPKPEPLPEPEPPAPFQEPAATENPVTPEPTTRPARRSSPRELGGWLGLHAGLALGVAPGVGGAVALEGGIKGKWWRAGLAIQTAPRRFVPHPGDDSVEGRFDLIAAQAFGCGVPHAGPVDFPLCARVAGGGLRGVGTGAVDRAEPAWGDWWGLGASAGAVWHAWKRLGPAVSAEVLAPLQTRSYSVGDVPGVLHRTGPVAFRAWLGLEIHL